MTLPMPVPKWLPDPQEYAIEQERSRHEQAMAHFGEYAMFILLWRLEDFEKGLVERCPTCWGADGSVSELIADAYGQPTQERCPDCFGTTFEGGFKARIVRLALWDFNEKDQRPHSRGEVEVQTASLQTTADFRLRTHDYILRGDGSRWRMQTISSNHLRTGFMLPKVDRTPLGYNFGQVVLEDKTSVAYDIPPSEAELAEIDLINSRYPTDWSGIEVIRGDLMHTEVDGGNSGSVGDSA